MFYTKIWCHFNSLKSQSGSFLHNDSQKNLKRAKTFFDGPKKSRQQFQRISNLKNYEKS